MTAIDLITGDHEASTPQTDNNNLSVKMAGQVRAIHKRRKNRAQRIRSRRR